jgi:glycosyltransferase involved in cell wall biosynthesis
METESSPITVVIPAFNRADTIGAALESVQAQTYPHWEAIVVDDGSTDTTAQVAERMARQDPRIRLLRQDRNRGAQAARNAAIRAARGKWICFLDSDDRFLPDSIERRLRVARETNVSVVHSNCYVLMRDAPLSLYCVNPVEGRTYRRLLEAEGPVFPGILVTREALERIGYLDETIVSFQEWDTAIRLAKHYEFGFEPEPTFIYDTRGGERISKDFLSSARGYLQILHKHFIAMLWYGGPRVIASHYQTAAWRCARVGDTDGARHCKRMARMWAASDPVSVVQRLGRVLRRFWSARALDPGPDDDHTVTPT